MGADIADFVDFNDWYWRVVKPLIGADTEILNHDMDTSWILDYIHTENISTKIVKKNTIK